MRLWSEVRKKAEQSKEAAGEAKKKTEEKRRSAEGNDKGRQKG